ncbi:glycosyltransferase family 4 protein [Shewanella eurypsychrophilus]|uniref:Glycosyltransferase family 4 protein n=1 Tax=Shewanella eurypsychrophilus TaxID=2593656 RepID=A0ABX6V9X6_9GAMM|nr:MULTISPECIES: glycosyltransferase family 4 protein [Shewanella]QFU23438.1 glycosyltransferase [Shewanella sp. YLB-09]QPG58666.1 glycosyltransferase family 4 protein [Shewanella eurypsychrophilus]
MKSVLITSNAYFPNIGGIENSLRYLALSYVSQGYHVDVVVSDVNSVTACSLAKYESLDGVHIHRYSSFSHLPLYLRPVRGLLSFFAMWQAYRKIKHSSSPVITISRFHSTTVMAKIAGLKSVTYLLPGVVKFQNTAKNLSKQSGFLGRVKQKIQWYLHTWIQQRAFNQADKLAVFSHNMQQQVNACLTHEKPLALLKPGVDTSRFCPLDGPAKSALKAELGLPLDKHVLLIVGRFVSAKGIVFALEAMRSLPGFHLVLVGGGEEEGLYQLKVSEYSLESSVTFAGVQQNPLAYYQSADAFLMTSVYEPLGQTILEALACALPVVAFQKSPDVITATNELLSADEAVFVHKLCATELAEQLKGLFASPQRMNELQLSSRQLAIKNFSWDVLAKHLLDD